MNEQQIVQNMIEFVEKTERDIQAAKLGTAKKEKTKAVGEMLKKLEREIKDADQ